MGILWIYRRAFSPPAAIYSGWWNNRLSRIFREAGSHHKNAQGGAFIASIAGDDGRAALAFGAVHTQVSFFEQGAGVLRISGKGRNTNT